MTQLLKIWRKPSVFWVKNKTNVQEVKLITEDTSESCQTWFSFFWLLFMRPNLFRALCWGCCTLQPRWNAPLFRKHNICFFWWRPHKSKSFISRRHTSLKTAGRILLFLSNRFHSIFQCQDPPWMTSTASIRIPYLAVFPLFSRHLSDKCGVPCVWVCVCASDLQRLAQTGYSGQ